MKSTLQSRIAIGMWIITIFSMLTAAVLSGHLMIQSHRDGIKEQLQTAATSLVSLGISKYSELNDFEQLDGFIADALQMEQVNKIVRIFNPSRQLVYSTMGLDYDPLPNTLETPIVKPGFSTLFGKQRKYESLVIPYENKGEKKPYALQIVIPLPQYSEIFKTLWWELLLLLGVLIVITLFLSHWLSKRLLKPVEAIATHLTTMDPNKIEAWRPFRLDKKGEYLESIAEGINLLAARTLSAVVNIRKMGRYVAHELRTPLTILQGEAETLLSSGKESSKEDYEKVLKSSLEEIQRMSDIVTTVLKVGETEGRSKILHAPSYDLDAWLQENRPRWEKTLGRNIEMPISKEKKMEILADPDLLFRLVDNLVRNIRDHTAAKTACFISVTSASGAPSLRVRDNGPGLPQSVVTALNEKGREIDLTGIGLDLCFKIAESCGLRLHFLNLPEGGLQVEIYF